MHGLLIRRPWIDLILSGKKTWEIRGSNTEIRGTIALIESGSKNIVGVAKLIDVHGPLDKGNFSDSQDLHLATPEELSADLPYAETYGWELIDAEPLLEPIPYEHPLGAITWVKLKDINEQNLLSVNKIYKIPSQSLKDEFIKSIESDLNYLNQKFKIKDKTNSSNNEISITTKLHSYRDRGEIETIYSRIRNRFLLSDKDFINTMEDKFNILEYFANGDQISVDKIKPEIRECKTQKEKDIYKYCRYLEEVPNTGGVGRRISAIIYDTGQKKEFIIGVLGLSSTGYTLRCRDDFFGWNRKSIDSFNLLKERKDDGLRKIMQLSVCSAVPPYNYLYAGKLIALLSLSDPIQQIYKTKYKQDLLALVTTGVFGDHSALFNRIQINKVIKNEKGERNELFKKIGNTSEYSNLILSNKTKEIAKEILKNTITYTRTVKNPNKNFSSNNELIRAIKICGLNKEILELNRKSVYIGALNNKNLNIIKGDPLQPSINLSVDQAFNYWKNDFLFKKYRINTEKQKQFTSFNKNQLSINDQLKLFI